MYADESLIYCHRCGNMVMILPEDVDCHVCGESLQEDDADE